MIVEQNKLRLDWVKWLAIFALLAIGIWLNFWYNHVAASLRIAVGIVLFCALLLVAVWTDRGQVAYKFLLESRQEMRKVIWPTRQETVQTMIMVVIVVAIVGVILWGVDWVFINLIGWVTGQRG